MRFGEAVDEVDGELDNYIFDLITIFSTDNYIFDSLWPYFGCTPACTPVVLRPVLRLYSAGENLQGQSSIQQQPVPQQQAPSVPVPEIDWETHEELFIVSSKAKT